MKRLIDATASSVPEEARSAQTALKQGLDHLRTCLLQKPCEHSCETCLRILGKFAPSNFNFKKPLWKPVRNETTGDLYWDEYLISLCYQTRDALETAQGQFSAHTNSAKAQLDQDQNRSSSWLLTQKVQRLEKLHMVFSKASYLYPQEMAEVQVHTLRTNGRQVQTASTASQASSVGGKDKPKSKSKSKSKSNPMMDRERKAKRKSPETTKTAVPRNSKTKQSSEFKASTKSKKHKTEKTETGTKKLKTPKKRKKTKPKDPVTTDVSLPYYGEVQCQHLECRNKAYYTDGKKVMCGVHLKQIRGRKQLRKEDPEQVNQRRQKEEQEHAKTVRKAQEENKKAGNIGTVIATKLIMMRTPPCREGYLQVWPNNKHQGKPGCGCAALSPMRLHAKDHKEAVWIDKKTRKVYDLDSPSKPDTAVLTPLPPALSIENFHQFAKAFASEVGGDGWPTQAFWKTLFKGYADSTPHRHKETAPKTQSKSKSKTGSKNRNAPEFSCRPDSRGKWHKFTYLESRWFYCCMYEKRVVDEPDFQKLKQLRAEGTNLEILGYDAYPVTKTLYEHYKDDSRPYGHEQVLLACLTVDNPTERPWHIFERENPHLYAAFK